MRGLIMAGGSGSRLAPITKVINKQLLPIYDKPIIFYPLTTLILAGIREIAIIVNPQDKDLFADLLGSGSEFGIDIRYIIQDKPAGIAQGLLLAEEFIVGHKVGMILGDNVFHGLGLGRQLQKFTNLTGAQVFTYQVADPENYGVAVISETGLVLDLIEKPKVSISNLAITGLYFYDETVIEHAKKLTPSHRGELEITDLNKSYLAINQLNLEVLSQGTAWLDTGTFKGLHDAATYIRIMEERQNSRIGDPKIAAKAQGYIK